MVVLFPLIAQNQGPKYMRDGRESGPPTRVSGKEGEWSLHLVFEAREGVGAENRALSLTFQTREGG
jgi:hypothetical protein